MKQVKHLISIITIAVILSVLCACGTKDKVNDLLAKTDSVSRPQVEQERDTTVTTDRLPDNSREEVADKLLSIYKTGDFRSFYENWYSKKMFELSGESIEDVIEQTRITFKRLQVKNPEIVDIIEKDENIFICTIGFTYVNEYGRDDYNEEKWYIYIEDGRWVTCSASQYEYWNTQNETSTIEIKAPTKEDNTVNHVTCSICAGSGQQYIPNLYYDSGMNMWMGGYIACPGCGGSGYVN